MFQLPSSPIVVLEYVSRYIRFTKQDGELVNKHAVQLQAKPSELASALQAFLEQHPEIFEQFAPCLDRPSTSTWLDQLASIYDALVAGIPDDAYVDSAVLRGRIAAQSGIPAICSVGVAEVYLEHAKKLIDCAKLSDMSKRVLKRSLRKRLLLDNLLQVHGFNLATQEQQNHQSQRCAHLYRLYATLSQVSMAILHAESRETLFQVFCDAAVKHGFSYAWVLQPSDLCDLIEPVAMAGRTNFGLFQQQKVSQKSDSPWGNGPTGLALRTGEMQVINETCGRASIEPWRSLFEQFQVRSLVSMPLKTGGLTVACFSLYADEPDFFGEDEVILVSVIAREISHALERLGAMQEHNEILAQLVWQRQHDELTGLPQRELFLHRVQQLLLGASEARHVAVALVGIDHFHEINSRCGHAVGDVVLCMLGDQLQARIGTHGLVARLGGNSFAIVTEQPGWTLPLLESVLKRIAVTQRILGHTLRVTASIGIVTGNQQKTPDELLRLAGVALDKARHDGGNRTCLFDDAFDAAIQQKEILQKNIQYALRNRELLPYFQPKINLVTGEVLGAEALVRWRQGTRIISPADFLPALAATNFMSLIDWAMLTAVAEVLATTGRFSAVIPSVSVNLSMQTLVDKDFSFRLARLIDHYGLRPAQLELEVLETVMLHEPSIVANLRACQEMGCEIAVDDFGTAASSLVHLLEIPSDTIKIDQRFARQLLNHAGNHAIISSMVTYTQLSNKKLCIEGVETLDIWHRLVAMGCTLGQGYAIAYPMHLVDFECWLNEWEGSFGLMVNKQAKVI